MSKTVSAKRRIMQIITRWVPGSWAGNSKCPTPIRAETVSRHNEVTTPGRKTMLSIGHIRDRNAVVRQVADRFPVPWFFTAFYLINRGTFSITTQQTYSIIMTGTTDLLHHLLQQLLFLTVLHVQYVLHVAVRLREPSNTATTCNLLITK